MLVYNNFEICLLTLSIMAKHEINNNRYERHRIGETLDLLTKMP